MLAIKFWFVCDQLFDMVSCLPSVSLNMVAPRQRHTAGCKRAGCAMPHASVGAFLIVYHAVTLSVALLQPLGVAAAPVPVTRLAEIQARLATCENACQFQFSGATVELAKSDSLHIQLQSNVSITGAPGGTTLQCRQDATLKAFISTNAGATTPASLVSTLLLQDLTISNCRNLTHFLIASGVSVTLKNITFASNTVAGSLLRLHASANHDHVVDLINVSFLGNSLGPGAHLVQVHNIDEVGPQGWNYSANAGVSSALRDAACQAGVFQRAPMPDLKQTQFLNTTLIDLIIDSAFESWVKTNKLAEAQLTKLLATLHIENLHIRNNTKAASLEPAVTDAGVGQVPTPCRANNTAGNDFLCLSGVNLALDGLQAHGNKLHLSSQAARVASQSVPLSCSALLHLSASAATLKNMTVQDNQLLTAIQVDTAVGGTELQGMDFTSNLVHGCPLVQFDGFSTQMDVTATAGLLRGPQASGCAATPTSLDQLLMARKIWDALFFIEDTYHQITGHVTLDGIYSLITKGVFGPGDLNLAAANMGMDHLFHNSTIADMAHTSFTCFLEHGLIHKSLRYKRDAPLAFSNALLTANTASNTSLIRITGFPNLAGTLCQVRDVSFQRNDVSPSANLLGHALLQADYAFGTVDGVKFHNNSANAIVTESSTLTLQDMNFVNNSAPGALVLMVSTNATGNVTALPGIRWRKVEITDNIAQGPMVAIQEANVQMESVLLHRNMADLNLGLWSDKTSDYFKFAHGVVFVRRAKWYMLRNITISMNAANTNIMVLNQTLFDRIQGVNCSTNVGTCLLLKTSWQRDLDLDGKGTFADHQKIVESTFLGNMATSSQAAGLQVVNLEWPWYTVANTTFQDNVIPDEISEGHGAALSVIPDLDVYPMYDAPFLYASNLTFTNNSAALGGAVHLRQARTTILNCTFTDNRASKIAGALYCDNCTWDYLCYTSFTGNKAPQGGALVADFFGYKTFLLPSGQYDQSFLLYNNFTNNQAYGKSGVQGEDPYNEQWEVCPAGAGGGLCLTVTDYPDREIKPSFYILGNSFTNNTATWGGAAFINNRTPLQEKHCHLIIENNTIVGNTAVNGSGAALFYNDSSSICLGCRHDAQWENLVLNSSSRSMNVTSLMARPFPQDTNIPLRTCCCNPGWANNNNVGNQSYGGDNDLATYGQSLEVQFCEGDPEHTYRDGQFSCLASSQTSFSGGVVAARASLRDSYNNTAPGSLTNITLIIGSADGLGTGLLMYNWRPIQLSRNDAVLKHVSIQTLEAPNGTTFPVTIIPLTRQRAFPPIVLNLTVRPCYLGEFLGPQFTCSPCDKGSFSLAPHLACLPCVSKASCYADVNGTTVGQGLLVPKPGYWKSTPYSPIPYRCPLSGACKTRTTRESEQRTHALLLLLTNRTYPLSLQDHAAFMQQQCSKGYTGHLCGNCDAGYGRTTDRCTSCSMGPYTNALFMLLALALFSCFLAVLVFNHARGVGQLVSDAGTTQPLNLGGNTTSSGETLVSIIKVLVSYVQVLAILRLVNVDWPAPLTNFLSTIDLTSAPGWVSLDCSIPSATHQTKAIVRSIVHILLPVFLSMAAAVFWACWGFIRRGRPHWASWHNYLVLTIIQACYLLHPSSSAAAFALFTCTSVDKVVDANLEVYRPGPSSPVAHIQEGRYWSQNYQHRCLTGSHAVVAFGLGLPSVLFFTLGFPFLSGVLLHQHKPSLYLAHTVLKYGFLYQEYQERYYAWESVVMLRKVSLLAMIVFTQPFGSLVQIFTASFIMYTNILLHDIFNPYHDHQVNTMERFSLIMNTFNLACLGLLVASSDSQLRIIIMSIMLVLNVSVIICFLYCSWHEAVVWARARNLSITTGLQYINGMWMSLHRLTPRSRCSLGWFLRWFCTGCGLCESAAACCSLPRSSSELTANGHNTRYVRKKRKRGLRPDAWYEDECMKVAKGKAAMGTEFTYRHL